MPAAVSDSGVTTNRGKVGKALHYVFSYLPNPFNTVKYKLDQVSSKQKQVKFNSSL